MKIALINDISGFGNCSLTAAISVLSAMGHETFPLPTATLSNQTGYEHYAMKDLTFLTEDFFKNWDLSAEKIDCVYSGFSPSPKTPVQAAELAKKHGAFFVLDPVLGDDGEFYKCFGQSFIPEYKNTIKFADVITPNLTELCFLTSANFNDVFSSQNIVSDVFELIDTLNAKNTVVTGISTGEYLLNVCKFGEKKFVYKTKALKKSYSGTGDLFASVLTGCFLKGYPPEKAVKTANKFVYKSIKYSVKLGIPGEHGTHFQKYLKTL